MNELPSHLTLPAGQQADTNQFQEMSNAEKMTKLDIPKMSFNNHLSLS